MANQRKTSNFRLSQALYKTILTNLQVILLLFIVAMVGWLFWYLSPLTKANTTYNADSYETAVELVVNHIADQAAITQSDNSQAASAPVSCALTDANNQPRFSDNINRLNQSLTRLYQQKRLANHYQLQTSGLWQQACEQKISTDAMNFAIKTLASPDKLMQLQWLEQQPNRRNEDTSSVARMPANWLTQTNPWYGLPGCVYIKTPKDTANPTGFLYIDNPANQDAATAVNQLCNHPRLIPQSLKAQLAADKPLNQAVANNSTLTRQLGQHNVIVSGVAQAANALQNLQDQPSSDPNYRIASTDTNNTALPANLNLMYSELANIHSSHFDRQLLDAYQSYQQQHDKRTFWQKLTAPPLNTIAMDGSNIKIGYNMQLTIDPTVQNSAQQVADCVTNSLNAQIDCSTLLPTSLQNVAGQFYENALVRSIGIAVLDVKSQRVLALASSDSNCYRADNGDTTIKPKGCPVLWKKDWSKQKLLNHALYQTVYPGSIVKTVQALALVRAYPQLKNSAAPDTRYIKQIFASSSTERVANLLYCQRTTSNIVFARDSQGRCPGLPALKNASDAMGWSANCKATNDSQNGGTGQCGFKDLLFGKPYNTEPMIQSRYFSGIMLTDGKQDYTPAKLNFSASQVASCVQANAGRMTGSCRRGGDQLNATMNEVFGAGNAKTSVLGAADMFASLLIADNGKQQRRGAHLIEDLWGVNQIPLRPKAWRGDAPYGQFDHLAYLPLNINQSDAKATLNLLSGTLLAGTGLGGNNGTAYRACQQALGSCQWTSGVIVGKTGTPGFNFPMNQGGRLVYTPNVTVNMVTNQCNKSAKPGIVCYNRPYKWFIYGIKDKQGQWDKAVAVLVERNWQKSGLIDDPHDGINRAVQAGMLLAKQLYQGDQ